jgi:hypothetical protein
VLCIFCDNQHLTFHTHSWLRIIYSHKSGRFHVKCDANCPIPSPSIVVTMTIVSGMLGV